MSGQPFVHLHLHTQYSLLDGAIRLENLFAKPVDLVESEGLQNPFFIKQVNASRKALYVAS